jgi:hypothetical protein
MNEEKIKSLDDVTTISMVAQSRIMDYSCAIDEILEKKMKK